MSALVVVLAGCTGQVAQAAPTAVLIAPGVSMPVVSNGYISGVYAKGHQKNASQTIAAYRTWITAGGRGIDTAYECARLTHP